MSKQLINLGQADKGNGDPLRTAFNKVNENFSELYSAIGDGVSYHLGDDIQFVDVDPASGIVVIQSGFDTGMPVYIKGANCSNGGVGGNVVIEAGGAPLPNTGTTGNIEMAAQQTTIDSNNNVWTFRDDGVLELPTGGDIVDSDGNTVLGGVGGSRDRLVSGNAELVLINDGTPYVLFPVANGSQLGIQGSEIDSKPGSDGLTLTAYDSSIFLATHIDQSPVQQWEFDRSGTINTPLLFPLSFTAVLDVEHRTSGGDGSYTGPAWEFNLEWQCEQNGQVVLMADNPLPSRVAGYANGQTFEFTEADHGIPGYTLSIVLSNVQHNPAGYTANLTFSEPPSYPSTINTSGAIKLTSNENSWAFGTDGSLTLPDQGPILFGGNNCLIQAQQGFLISSEGGIVVASIDITNPLNHIVQDWVFGPDGALTLPAGGTINNTDGIKLVTDRGTLAIGTNMETLGVAGHLHIAFDGSNSNPPASDLFLGDDYNYVKLPGYELNPAATYGVEIVTNDRDGGPQNIEVRAVDELVPPGGVWRFFISHEDYPNLGSSVSVGDTVTTSWGTPITATITDVIEDPGVRWKIHVAQDITAGFSSYDTVSFGSQSNSYTWRFGTDGTLALPTGGDIVDSSGTSVLGGTGGGLSVSDFGRGFTNTLDAGKITTSKLYNRPANLALNNHFVLEVTDGGVVVLPDQSIINGATLKTVPGNYAALMAGPVGKDEDSQMWVDPDGAWIATKYNTDQKVWQFDNNGALILPGTQTITDDAGDLVITNPNLRAGVSIGVHNPSETPTHWYFASNGQFNFPSGAGFARGDNGQLKTNDGATLSLDFRDTGGRGFYTNGDGFSLRSNGNNTWKFDTDGSLTVPGDIKSTAGVGPVVIEANDGTLRTWTFGGDGFLTFPGAAGHRTTFGSAGAIGDVLHSINDLVLKSDHGVTVVSGENTGALDLQYQEAQMILELVFQENQYSSGYPWGCTLPISSQLTYSELIEYPGTPFNDPPGDLVFKAKTASDAWYAWQAALNTSGIDIGVGNHGWHFGSNGKLTLPTGGDIVDSDGNTVLGGTVSIIDGGDASTWATP